MASETWVNVDTGEVMTFSDGETFVLLRTTDDCSWMTSGLSAVDFMVLMAAACMINKSGYFSVSNGRREKMAKELNVTERSISDSLRRMDEKDIITRVGGGEYLMNPGIISRSHARLIPKRISEYYGIRNNKKDGRED
jgi:hypothetical protein